MKRNLPPLNALRAFEASARLGSMQRAAHELNGPTFAHAILTTKELVSALGKT